MSYQYLPVEVPFNFRHRCWFCNEPAANDFSFPQTHNVVLTCVHPPLTLPCCKECLLPAQKSKANSIWLVFSDVKKYLIMSYQKDLAIGVNWSKEELENSEFEQGNFAGFKKSAWMMYEIAKERVNFKGWPLVVEGINLEEYNIQEIDSFAFDGVIYPSINAAVEHYAKTFNLHKGYFEQVLLKVGQQRFSTAVRFCRLLVNATPEERNSAIKSL